jgi:hypothetical protein
MSFNIHVLISKFFKRLAYVFVMYVWEWVPENILYDYSKYFIQVMFIIKINNTFSLGCKICECVSCLMYSYLQWSTFQGQIQHFKLGEGVLKKIAPSGGRREHFWSISCEKSWFYAKKSYFFQLRGRRVNFWGISCEKSRFYAKKSYFFQF